MKNEKSSNISIFFKNIYYVPSLKRVYIDHYHLNFFCIIPAIIFQYTEIYFLQNIIYPYLANSKEASAYYPFIILFYFVSAILFIMNIIVGPGYLPFDYFQKGKDIQIKKERIDDYLDKNLNDFENPNNQCGNKLGIAISEDDIKQVNSVLMLDLDSTMTIFLSFLSFFKLPQIISNHQPPFADYIVSERRYVIDPLVFDNLSGLWIGKKNAKLFLFYRFFLSIASLMACFSYLDIMVDFVEEYCFGLYFLEIMFLLMLILVKAFFQIILSLRIINEIAFTKYNRFGKIIYENYEAEKLTFTPSEVYRNFKIFFGENPFYWILPIPPFQGLSDEELYYREKKKFMFS